MKKEIRSDILLLVLNLVAIFFIVNTGIFSVQIPVGNFYIYLSSLVAAILIVVLVMLKNNYKTIFIKTISDEDLKLFLVSDSIEEGIELIKKCIEQFGLKPMKGRPNWLLGEKK